MNDVRIFEMSNGGYTGNRWLCPRHVAERAAKWTLKPGVAVPHDLTCDDCVRETQQAPGYTSPVVDFVPTTTDPPPRAAKPKAAKPKLAPRGMFDEGEAA